MLTSTLENVLNRGLPRSPRAQQLCAELAGRRVGIRVASLPSAYVLVESTGTSLKLSGVTAGKPVDAPPPEAPPDAPRAPPAPPDVMMIVTGGPLSLLALSGPAPEAVLQRGDVRIDGDAELAQKFPGTAPPLGANLRAYQGRCRAAAGCPHPICPARGTRDRPPSATRTSRSRSGNGRARLALFLEVRKHGAHDIGGENLAAAHSDEHIVDRGARQARQRRFELRFRKFLARALERALDDLPPEAAELRFRRLAGRAANGGPRAPTAAGREQRLLSWNLPASC